MERHAPRNPKQKVPNMIEEVIARNTEALVRLAQAVERLTKAVPADTIPATTKVEDAPATELPAKTEAPEPAKTRGRPRKDVPELPTEVKAPEVKAPEVKAPSSGEVKNFIRTHFLTQGGPGTRDDYNAIATNVLGKVLPIDGLDDGQRTSLMCALEEFANNIPF